MNLKLKIKCAGFTLAELARRCGVSGSNPARTVHRYLSGERDAPSEFRQAVIDLVGESIGIRDFHDVRLAWLRSNRPDRLTIARRPRAVTENRNRAISQNQEGQNGRPAGAA